MTEGAGRSRVVVVRVALPHHLRTLAGTGPEVRIEVPGPVTQALLLDALEARFPVLTGTLRDATTKKRRPYVRFFACAEDHSHDDPAAPLPPAVASGSEPFVVLGALAGG